MTLSSRNFPWTAAKARADNWARLVRSLRDGLAGSRAAFDMLRLDRQSISDEDLKLMNIRLDQLIEQGTAAVRRQEGD